MASVPEPSLDTRGVQTPGHVGCREPRPLGAPRAEHRRRNCGHLSPVLGVGPHQRGELPPVRRHLRGRSGDVRRLLEPGADLGPALQRLWRLPRRVEEARGSRGLSRDAPRTRSWLFPRQGVRHVGSIRRAIRIRADSPRKILRGSLTPRIPGSLGGVSDGPEPWWKLAVGTPGPDDAGTGRS